MPSPARMMVNGTRGWPMTRLSGGAACSTYRISRNASEQSVEHVMRSVFCGQDANHVSTTLRSFPRKPIIPLPLLLLHGFLHHNACANVYLQCLCDAAPKERVLVKHHGVAQRLEPRRSTALFCTATRHHIATDTRPSPRTQQSRDSYLPKVTDKATSTHLPTTH